MAEGREEALQEASLNALPDYPCQTHCLFNTTSDPSETHDVAGEPSAAAHLQAMLRRYAELSTQGLPVFGYPQMLNEAGASWRFKKSRYLQTAASSGGRAGARDWHTSAWGTSRCSPWRAGRPHPSPPQQHHLTPA